MTICTSDMSHLFGKIVGAAVPGRPHTVLSNTGKIIENAINYYNENLNGISFDVFVIMPNHIHAIISINHEEAPAGGRGRPPLQRVVGNLKAFVSKQVGFSPWQKGFHDHIIRNDRAYQKIWEYIENNPYTWVEDRYYSKEETP